MRQGDDALHRASGFPELLQKHLLTGFFALTTLADFFFKVIGALLVPNGGVHELFLQVVDALLLLSHGGVASFSNGEILNETCQFRGKQIARGNARSAQSKLCNAMKAMHRAIRL